MTLTTSSRIVMRGIGCTLILLLELSAQAIDYEAYIHDATPMKLRNDIALTSRDFLERFDFINPKTSSYTLQEGTEYWLHFGAFLRARILDTFGDLLYIHYDDFSIAEVDALRKVYQTIIERRYHMFDLVPDILRNPDTRPSRICAAIYAHADSCLRDSASVCHRIRKHHDRAHSDDLNITASNITYSVYRSSRISKHYPRGFSLLAVLKLLQRGALTITPGLLSGLLYNARYDSPDDDVRLAERELVRYLDEVQRSSGHGFMEILKPLPFRELKKFRNADSFLKYYISVHAESFSDDDLRRHASLIAKRIVGDGGTIDENIHLLGNVYENETIHVGYLFDLVLPDDVLNEDVVEAKRYLAKKLDELDVVERYLRVQKYRQATPAELAMEITGQLKDVGFAQDIATALRMHARFWRRSRMIESLDELLVLFDAYENLRRVPRYRNMMENIDQIRKSLWDTRDVPVEILCNAPRACLRIGLQTVLHCRFVNPEIKALIGDFLRRVTLKGALLADECLQTTRESRRAVDISFKLAKVRLSTTKMSTTDTTRVTGMETTKTEMTVGETTPRASATEQDDRNVTTETWETYESRETTETVQASDEITEELSTEPKTSSEENMEFASTTMVTPKVTKHVEYEETAESILATTTLPHREETTAATTSTVAATTTVAQTTTTKSPATTTTTVSPTTTTTTVSPTTTTATASPTTTTTSPTITTMLPTSTTSSVTTTTASPNTTTAESLATSTATTPTTIASTSPATTVAVSSTITDKVPDIEMGLKRSKTFTIVPVLDDENLQTEDEKISETTTTFVTATPPRGCESGECSSERSSEETARYETSTTSTLKTQAPTSTVKESATSTTPTTQASTFVETTRTASSELTSTQDRSVTSETTVATTESSKTPVTEEECTRSNSESTERPRCAATDCSGKSCSDVDCDSLMTDCDDEDMSERPQNRSVKCSRIRCEKESPEVSSECETEISGTCEDSECTSKDEEGSAECVKLCITRERSSSCGDQDDCSSTERPTIDVKFERTRNRSMCEIRDPHHRRQLRRLAKMRAISAATTDDTRSRMPRERIATNKIYDLLATGLPRFKNERSRKTAGYLLKRSLGTASRSIEVDGGWKRRKQRDQIYGLRKESARRIGRKSTDGRSKYRSGRTPVRQRRNERISRRGAKSIRAARERAIGDRNASI